MTDYTSLLALKALDGLHSRMIVTAENIANANTPNYRPLRLNFEGALKTAAEKDMASALKLEPTIERQSPNNPDGMRLDLELATSASTSLRYSAIIDILNRHLRMHSLAVSGGT